MDTGSIVALFKFKRWADTETLQAIQSCFTVPIIVALWAGCFLTGVTPPKDVLTVFLRDHNH
ncbi:hypothetical protein AI2983V1_2056 [Enterobacter cloacae]|nr:hypothetical protein AI2983V1_2056 [Enterobacter cloacae]CAH5618882.1 hypothetical protein AI2983V1_2056 [Enterobacter cloacae]